MWGLGSKGGVQGWGEDSGERREGGVEVRGWVEVVRRARGVEKEGQEFGEEDLGVTREYKSV